MAAMLLHEDMKSRVIKRYFIQNDEICHITILNIFEWEQKIRNKKILIHYVIILVIWGKIIWWINMFAARYIVSVKNKLNEKQEMSHLLEQFQNQIENRRKRQNLYF